MYRSSSPLKICSDIILSVTRGSRIARKNSPFFTAWCDRPGKMAQEKKEFSAFLRLMVYIHTVVVCGFTSVLELNCWMMWIALCTVVPWADFQRFQFYFPWSFDPSFSIIHEITSTTILGKAFYYRLSLVIIYLEKRVGDWLLRRMTDKNAQMKVKIASAINFFNYLGRFLI